MKSDSRKVNYFNRAIACVLVFTLVISCQKSIDRTSANNESVAGKEPKSLKDFEQVNLVGDNDEYSPAFIDTNLVNGWGISFPSASGPPWVSAEGTGKTVIYRADGSPVAFSPVSIPGAGTSTVGHPTGQVFNGTSDFKLPNGNAARFIFAGADGVISGWNGGTTAIKKVDDSPDASYLGIALASDQGNNFLYVANFAEKKIDVYDKNWAEVSKPFVDPELPSDYSPFNIQNVGGKLYVMYSKLGDDGDEVVSPGNGYVDIYNTDGSLMKRFISRGQLNAPWGVAKAPAGFFGADGQEAILVGNFGDGHINAYNIDGEFLGQLRSHGNPIEIEGLWGISFAPTTSTPTPSTIDPNRLYFAAGPDDEEHGLFGYIIKSE
jgi:uncharacterized protein (TIGR03118 family)